MWSQLESNLSLIPQGALMHEWHRELSPQAGRPGSELLPQSVIGYCPPLRAECNLTAISSREGSSCDLLAANIPAAWGWVVLA